MYGVVVLIVSGGEYLHLNSLSNTTRDGKMFLKKMVSLGATGKHIVNPPNREALEKGLLDFREGLPAGTRTIWFFFTGHGFRHGGQNYLVPCKVNKFVSPDQAKLESMSVEWVEAVLKCDNKVAILMLDCCRTDPTITKGVHGLNKAVPGNGQGGLAAMKAKEGVVVVYSTAPGKTSLDGRGGEANSPFMIALLERLDTPDKCVTIMLKSVKKEVKRMTDQMQVPYVDDDLDGEHILISSSNPPPEKAPTTEAQWRQLEADFRNDSKLAKYAGELRTGKELSINFKELEDAQAVLIAKLLEYSSTLLELRLPSNSIGPEGATAIADALQNSSTLLGLILYNNNIGDTGATALAGALENSSTLLEKLDLSDNSVGPAGATALGEALAKNSSNLLELYLGGNQIGDEGARSLAEGLQHSSTLLVNLYLGGNGIGDSGKNALQAAVQGKKCQLYM